MNRLELKRRALIGAAGTCVVAAGLTARIAPASAQAEPAKPGMTPDEALATLKKGNAEWLLSGFGVVGLSGQRGGR